MGEILGATWDQVDLVQTVSPDDPDWAAGVTLMSTSCGEIAASVMKDGWTYAVPLSDGARSYADQSGGNFNFSPRLGHDVFRWVQGHRLDSVTGVIKKMGV